MFRKRLRPRHRLHPEQDYSVGGMGGTVGGALNVGIRTDGRVNSEQENGQDIEVEWMLDPLSGEWDPRYECQLGKCGWRPTASVGRPTSATAARSRRSAAGSVHARLPCGGITGWTSSQTSDRDIPANPCWTLSAPCSPGSDRGRIARSGKVAGSGAPPAYGVRPTPIGVPRVGVTATTGPPGSRGGAGRQHAVDCFRRTGEGPHQGDVSGGTARAAARRRYAGSAIGSAL